MDIKLRARLSAYSKVNNADFNNQIPIPTGDNKGDVLGVNNSGDYTFLDIVNTSYIDTLFEKTPEPEEYTIAGEENIDTVLDDTTLVSYSNIDSLFD